MNLVSQIVFCIIDVINLVYILFVTDTTKNDTVNENQVPKFYSVKRKGMCHIYYSLRLALINIILKYLVI